VVVRDGVRDAGLAAVVAAQTGEFLPELDAYYKVSSQLRIWMQGKGTYEAGDPMSAVVSFAFLRASVSLW
jgi:hypothetical protein